MLGYITLLLICQLIGEVMVRAFGLPLPGPVAGMLVLFVGLLIKGKLPTGLEHTADGLLRHLSLLFVPAAVGVMTAAPLLGAEWLPILGSVVVGTIITIGVTGWVMQALLRDDEESKS